MALDQGLQTLVTGVVALQGVNGGGTVLGDLKNAIFSQTFGMERGRLDGSQSSALIGCPCGFPGVQVAGAMGDVVEVVLSLQSFDRDRQEFSFVLEWAAPQSDLLAIDQGIRAKAIYVNFTDVNQVGDSHAYFEGDPIKNTAVRRFFRKALNGDRAEEDLSFDAARRYHFFD